MNKKFHTIDVLPESLALFPLSGALLLPAGELPLNIFEPRYVAMIDAALMTPHRLIGWIQPRHADGMGPIVGDGGGASPSSDLYSVGCAGRINSFHETDDGRYIITLAGVCRFRIKTEQPQQAGFRRATVDYTDFAGDFSPSTHPPMDRVKLFALLKSYFHVEGLMCNWENIKKASDDTLVTVLSMACPFEPAEKQAILEACTPQKRAEIFMTMLEMAVIAAEQGTEPSTCH